MGRGKGRILVRFRINIKIHNSPSRASYGVSFFSSSEKNTEIESRHDANFVVNGGTGGCRYVKTTTYGATSDDKLALWQRSIFTLFI